MDEWEEGEKQDATRLEADQAEWNRLQADTVGGQGSTRGFSAPGWMADQNSCTVFVS